MSTKAITYNFYYKEGIVLRSYKDEKTFERHFESFSPKDKMWQPLPSNQILSMNMGKFRISEHQLLSCLQESCATVFQKGMEKANGLNGCRNGIH